MKSIKKYAYFGLGSLSLFLGFVGIFLPVLPTTPFLLLAAFCYLRSSQRMYNWLMNHRIFGAYIYCYVTYKAIPKKTRARGILFLWLTLMISMLLVRSWHLRLFLMVVGVAVTTHLWMLKTLTDEDMRALRGLYGRKSNAEELSEEE